MAKLCVQILVCDNCQKDISEPTEIIEDLAANIDTRSPVKNYHTPIGKTVRYTVDHRRAYNDEPTGSKFYWMNGNNLLPIVRPIREENTYGCCGHSGNNNMRCACGNIIGSLYTSCCGPHFFRPSEKETYFTINSETSPERYNKLIERNKLNARNKKRIKT